MSQQGMPTDGGGFRFEGIVSGDTVRLHDMRRRGIMEARVVSVDEARGVELELTRVPKSKFAGWSVGNRTRYRTAGFLEVVARPGAAPAVEEAAVFPPSAAVEAGAEAMAAEAARPVDGERVRVLESRVTAQMREPEGYRAVGEQIRNSREAAVVFQPYRNPLFETFWWVLMKGDRVVRVHGVTVKAVGETVMDDRDGRVRAWVRDMLASGAADSFVVVHNHPSGNPTPSGMDRNSTRRMFGEGVLGDAFRYHVVIDHGTYSVIDRKGRVRGGVIREVAARPDPLLKPTGPVLGKALPTVSDGGPERVAELMVDVKPGRRFLGVLFVNSQFQVQAVAEVDLRAAEEDVGLTQGTTSRNWWRAGSRPVSWWAGRMQRVFSRRRGCRATRSRGIRCRIRTCQVELKWNFG